MDRHENCRCQPQPREGVHLLVPEPSGRGWGKTREAAPPFQPDPDLIVFHDDQPSALVMLAVAGGLVVLGVALIFLGSLGGVFGWIL